jgi:hypothetical protein
MPIWSEATKERAGPRPRLHRRRKMQQTIEVYASRMWVLEADITALDALAGEKNHGRTQDVFRCM